MKFKGPNQQAQFSSVFQECETNTFPFAEILLQKDLIGIKYIDSEEIGFENIFQIKVNVKKTGSILFFFAKESFNKDGFVEEVGHLADVASDTMGDVIYKTRTLYEVASKYSPLFSIYCPNGELVLFQDCFESLTNGIVTYYLTDYSPELIESLKSKKPSKSVEKKEEKPQGKKNGLRNPFNVLKEDKFHYLFGLISAFLIGFTIEIAIYDMYLGKQIYYFFLVCALIGAVLNVLIYKDTFKSHSAASTEFIVDVVTSIVGLGLGVGGYFLFDYFAKDKANPNLLLLFGIPVGVTIVSVLIGLMIGLIIKKKRA